MSEQGRAEAAKWCYDCLCACPGNANNPGLASLAGPGGWLARVIGGQPAGTEAPSEGAATGPRSSGFPLSDL